MGVRHALMQLRSGGGLGLFPPGAVSDLSLREGCVRDRPWQPAIIALIAKARVPIMPVRFFDRNSSFYYTLGLIDWRVRLLRLPAEVFNKADRPVRIGLAPLISVEEQQRYLATHTIEEFGTWLRGKVYGMEIRS
jgi:putative hemolysin